MKFDDSAISIKLRFFKKELEITFSFRVSNKFLVSFVAFYK